MRVRARKLPARVRVQIRFGLAAIIFAIVGAGSQGAISALGATSTSTPEDQADPNWVNTECLRLAIQHAGNPLDSFMKVRKRSAQRVDLPGRACTVQRSRCDCL